MSQYNKSIDMDCYNWNMSWKEFISSRIPDDNFIKEIKTRQEKTLLRRPDFCSPIGALGLRIAEAGSDGLKALAYKSHRGASATSQQTPEITAAAQADPARDFAAIVFGNFVHAIDRGLITGVVDLKECFENVSRNLVGTAWSLNMDQQYKKQFGISEGHLTQAREAARRDPTLACFFETDALQWLPEQVQRAITTFGVNNGPLLDHIYAMLPGYKSLAQVLITKREDIPLGEQFERTVIPRVSIPVGENTFGQQPS